MSSQSSEKFVSLKLARSSLDAIPQYALPPGFSLRWYTPGLEEEWLAIHLLADRFNRITPALFEQQFGRARDQLAQRQCYLTHEHRVVATGTAWFDSAQPPSGDGRIHWLAVLPEYQGRGLGAALMTILCERLKQLGHRRAWLTTSSGRVPALRLYLRFGFKPVFENSAQQAAWGELVRGPLRK